MTKADFIYLDVQGLQQRFGHDPSWHQSISRWTTTQVEFFKSHKLLRKGAAAWTASAESAVIRFFDFTPEGQDFIMSQAVEKWLASCDRRKDPAAYSDSSGLERRLKKFREQRSS